MLMVVGTYIVKEKMNSKYIICSRVDSDDLLNKDYIEITQKMAKPNIALICKNGYVIFSGESPPIFRRIKWKIGQIYTKLSTKFKIR